MTLISRDLIPASELARDPLVLHAKRKAELKAEQERRERRQRRNKLDIRPMTPTDVDERIGVTQEAQDEAIGQIVGELRGEIEQLREQVAELSKELAFTKGLLTGSSGAKLKFFNVRGQFHEGERYDRTDVVTRGDAWYVAKRDDPRGVPATMAMTGRWVQSGGRASRARLANAVCAAARVSRARTRKQFFVGGSIARATL